MISTLHVKVRLGPRKYKPRPRVETPVVERPMSNYPGQHGRRYPIDTPLGERMNAMCMSVRQLSQYSGVNARQISDYLARRTNPNRATAINLAKALRVPDDEFDDVINAFMSMRGDY